MVAAIRRLAHAGVSTGSAAEAIREVDHDLKAKFYVSRTLGLRARDCALCALCREGPNILRAGKIHSALRDPLGRATLPAGDYSFRMESAASPQLIQVW